MLNAMSVAGFVMLVSTVGVQTKIDSKSCDLSVKPATTNACHRQISFARAFVGGQDVVQVTRGDARKTPFMDVKASDLLISYVFDKKGRVTDRKVWFDQTATVASAPSVVRVCSQF